MAQVTIYMDKDTAQRAKRAARGSGHSLSKWIASLIRQKTEERWPDAVRTMAGAWKDMPTAEDLRSVSVADVPREPF